MSEVRLLIRDPRRDIHATCHGSFAERVVAALSAEPETIEEFDSALQRFEVSPCGSRFTGFVAGLNDETFDAGVVIIDLAARLVVADCTYFSPCREGYVDYHDGRAATECSVRFHLSGEWLLASDALTWRGQAEARRRQRSASPPLDVREILYGQPLLDFISSECYAAFAHATVAPVVARTESVGSPTDVSEPQVNADDGDAIRQIHIHWMMSTRDDLRGQCPREVMIARHDHISWDSQDRQEQWSQLGRCPPPLDPDSAAYRYAGFGTHEHVVYYDLVRELLWSCREAVAEAAVPGRTPPLLATFLSSEVPRLARLRDSWLDLPNPEFGGRAPRSVIDNERLRRPEGMTGQEAMIDCDCPLCQMQADMPGPVFWGLDGSNMDDDFAFDFYYATLDEWQEEQRRSEEFSRRFEAEWAERERLGVRSPDGGYSDSDVVWRRSFYASEAEEQPLLMRLFSIGCSLSEIVVDLKEVAAEYSSDPDGVNLVNRLNRDFGNLREVAQAADVETASALVGPVVDRFCQTLDDAATLQPHLQAKCANLQSRLRRFAEPPNAEMSDEDAGWWQDEEEPF